MRTGLHPVPGKDYKGRIMYCGPHAMIAATGKTSEQVTRAINSARYKKDAAAVGHTTTSDLKAAFIMLGYKTTAERLYQRDTMPTFAQWRAKEQHGRDATYLVLITNHWITVRGDWLTDTRHATPHDLSRSNPYARKRVQAVIRIIGGTA